VTVYKHGIAEKPLVLRLKEGGEVVGSWPMVLHPQTHSDQLLRRSDRVALAELRATFGDLSAEMGEHLRAERLMSRHFQRRFAGPEKTDEEWFFVAAVRYARAWELQCDWVEIFRPFSVECGPLHSGATKIVWSITGAPNASWDLEQRWAMRVDAKPGEEASALAALLLAAVLTMLKLREPRMNLGEDRPAELG